MKEAMDAKDKEIAEIAEHKNAMESIVLGMRDAANGPQKAHLPLQDLDSFLIEIDNWLMSEEAESMSLPQVRAKRQKVEECLQEMCADYFEEQKKTKVELERSLETESAKASEEKGEDEVDKDQRKLKKPERMRLLLKNREEGNELFQGKNWNAAGARYAKALSHADKFFDLGPDDQEEVNNLRITLYLNLALCYLKMEKWDMVVANCSKALELDRNNVKALYRRASANFSRKNYEECERDVDQAFELSPQDPSVVNLRASVKGKIREQVKAEKSMWTRAFGTK